MSLYVIGIDFGTLSGRCLLVDVERGTEVAEAVMEYPHGVMDRSLPDGTPLPPDYALQHPQDYLDVLQVTVREVLRKAELPPKAVVGIGIDFTACSPLPIDREGTPLCMRREFENDPHAYVKLWKHHAAQREADEINSLAAQRREGWLLVYGGRISSEWMLPKLLQVSRESPRVYEATDRWIEAADWISLMLTGVETHAAAFAGYKALWSKEYGYPKNEFMKALDPTLDGVVGTKLSPYVASVDGIAGVLNERGAALTGLCAGTRVALPMIDAHAAAPALGMTRDGDLAMILGTSACHILQSRQRADLDGVCGYVQDGVVPSMYTYETGQPALGDIFGWFVERCVPQDYVAQASQRGIGLFPLLEEKATALHVGESGLLALDWWNGNRSVLSNSMLSGLILGLNLQTRPEDIYRAMIEASAFGVKRILDQLEDGGIQVGRICAAGGISQKNALLMQIYADVLEREIEVSGSRQAAALGSAIYAAVAAGCYSDLHEASARLAKPSDKRYLPNAAHAETYRALYAEYCTLHDYFGKQQMTMERIKRIKENATCQTTD